MPEPTKAVKPVLPVTLPLIKRMVPPTPAVRVGVPVIKMLPPVVVPTAAFLPALINTAETVALVVLIPWVNVKSPDKVSTSNVPVPVMPLVVNNGLVTVPTVNAPALVNEKLLSLVAASPPAKVSTLLLVLFNVNVPVPCRPKPDAVMGAVCVTAPVAYMSMKLFVAVSAPLMANAPPYISIGPPTA